MLSKEVHSWDGALFVIRICLLFCLWVYSVHVNFQTETSQHISPNVVKNSLRCTKRTMEVTLPFGPTTGVL